MEKVYVGIDVGGTTIKVGLVDSEGNIFARRSTETRPEERTSEQILFDISRLVLELLSIADVPMDAVGGIGMGVPGTVNSEKGIVTYSGNLRFKNVDVMRVLREFFRGMPILVNNDANCAALGEARFGSGKGFDNVILVTLGTGVGTGFIVDGKILEGKFGEGAEGGHICIKMGGEKCTCGQRGCWETYASATALVRQTLNSYKRYPNGIMGQIIAADDNITARTAFLARKNGDRRAAKVVSNYVGYIAVGIVNLVNVFRPDVVMIGGGVSHEGEYFIKMIDRAVRRHAFGGKQNHPPKVVPASLGNDAGIIGAAALVMPR